MVAFQVKKVAVAKTVDDEVRGSTDVGGNADAKVLSSDVESNWITCVMGNGYS